MSQLCADSQAVRALSCRLLSGTLLLGALLASAAGAMAADGANEVQLVEGDILSLSGASSGRWARRSISLSRASQLWTDGIVPYRIDPSLSESIIRSVNEAIEHWNEVGGITLMSLDDWPSGQMVPGDSILFQPGAGCASWVGRLGGEQEVWVTENCTAGSVMHEIGHVLGLEHEHTRPDRDQYIQINWDNISADKRHNFDVAPEGSRLLGEYDYESIMHYGTKNFSVNGEQTITPLLVSADIIGQRDVPSEGDLAAIARLYAADLSIATQLYSSAQGAEVSVYVSNQMAQGANTIEVDVQVGSSRLVKSGGSGWQCATQVDALVSCALGRLPGSSSTVLTLELAGAIEASQVTAEVRSKTPDDDTHNNVDNVDSEPEQASALADPVTLVTTTTVTYGGAAPWLWLVLLQVLFQRLAGDRVNRHARDRVKGFPRWCAT